MNYKIIVYDAEKVSILKRLLDRFPDEAVKFIIVDAGITVLSIKINYLDEVIAVISNLIVDYMFNIVLNSEIKQYNMLNYIDKEKVIEIVKYKLNFIRERYVMIYNDKFNNFFKIKKNINLNGFINFCTVDYVEEIEFMIDDAVDEYLSGNEYKEFISLLRYYIKEEEPRFDKLIIEADENGIYNYFNCKHNNITYECNKNFVCEFKDEYADEDDKLISILITMLPKKIFIYGTKNINNKNILETLKDIFENRIELYANDFLMIKK